MTTTIQHRRGSTAEWTNANPVLSDGELGYEKDSGKLKIGNGIDPWLVLAYTTSDPTAQSASVNLDQLPPAALIVVDKAKAIYGAAGAWPSARPSARTDLVMLWLGDTDPGAVAISGDIVDLLG